MCIISKIGINVHGEVFYTYSFHGIPCIAMTMSALWAVISYLDYTKLMNMLMAVKLVIIFKYEQPQSKRVLTKILSSVM